MKRGRIIFDMDGVITSEDGYWRAAACALREFAAHLGHVRSREETRDETLPWRLHPDLPTVARAKALLINTNWDLCHLAAIALARRLCAHAPENAERLREIDWRPAHAGLELSWPPDLEPDLNPLVSEILHDAGPHRGFEMMEELARSTGAAAPLFARKGPVWQWLFHAFQEWFNGTAAPRRAGIIEGERLLLEPERLAATLSELSADGWQLGIATGRTRAELLPTLTRFDLLHHFHAHSLVTHDEVAAAEQELAVSGLDAHLSKPHPFPFLRALFPDLPPRELAFAFHATLPGETVIVGDTVADIAAAVKIAATPVAVLTGPAGAGATASLTAAGAQFVIPDVTHLPELLRQNKPS